MSDSNSLDYQSVSPLPALPVLKVLMIADGKIASSEIISSLFEGLHDQGAISFRCLYENLTTYSERAEAVEWADLLFFFRVAFPPALSLLRLAQRKGKSVIYCTDDDFLQIDQNSPLGQIYHRSDNASAFRAICKEADRLWLFTEEMARRYRSLNSKIILGQLPSPIELFKDSLKGLHNDSEETLTIGYAGSFIHEKDLQVVHRPLLKLLEEKKDRLRVEFIGYVPKDLKGHPQVKEIPYFKSLNDFYRYMVQARWSIGLALLEDSPFNRGKTNNKYREYGSFGIPGIYSDMPVYSSCIKHRVNGYLTSHTEDGVEEALRTMLEDTALRRKIRKEALQDVSSHFSLKGAQLQLLRELSLLAIEKIPKIVERPKLLVIGYDKVFSTHIDALQPCRVLTDQKLLEFKWKEPGQVNSEDIQYGDGVYLVRSFENVNLPVLGWISQEQKPLICSWDDLFFLLPATTPLGQFYSEEDYQKVARRFLQSASLVMASTPPLAEYSRRLNPRVMEAIYGFKPPSCPDQSDHFNKSTTTTVRIGFFGVNLGVTEPFMVEALKELRKRYQDRVILEIIGLRPSQEVLDLCDGFFDPIWNIDEALCFLKTRGWDIGLAPLIDNEFNASKQATKFRDYAWCGAAIIASDVPTYRRTMINGIHGLLVENTSEAWVKAMTYLIENNEERQFLIRGAKLLLEAVYTQDKTIASWYQLIWRMMKYKLEKEASILRQPLNSLVSSGKAERGTFLFFAEIQLKNSEEHCVYIDKDHWVGIDILAEELQRFDIGPLTLRIYLKNGNLIRQTIINLTKDPKEEWLCFRFPPISNSSGKTFILKFDIPTKKLKGKKRLYKQGKFKDSKDIVKCRLCYVI